MSEPVLIEIGKRYKFQVSPSYCQRGNIVGYRKVGINY